MAGIEVEEACRASRALAAELPRGLRVRVSKWLERLSEPTTNRSFRRNRMHYLNALLHNMRRGPPFREPFNALPPDGALAVLSLHLREAAPKSRNRGAARAVQREQRGGGGRAARRRVENVEAALERRPAAAARQRDAEPMCIDELESGGERLVDGYAAVIARLRAQLATEHDAHRRELQRVRQLHANEIEGLKEEHMATVDLLRAQLGKSPTKAQRGGAALVRGADTSRDVDDSADLGAVKSWLERSAPLAFASAPPQPEPYSASAAAAAASPLAFASKSSSLLASSYARPPLQFGDLPIALRASGSTFDHIVNSSEDDFMSYLENFQQESERLAAKLKGASIVARPPPGVL